MVYHSRFEIHRLGCAIRLLFVVRKRRPSTPRGGKTPRGGNTTRSGIFRQGGQWNTPHCGESPPPPWASLAPLGFQRPTPPVRSGSRRPSWSRRASSTQAASRSFVCRLACMPALQNDPRCGVCRHWTLGRPCESSEHLGRRLEGLGCPWEALEGLGRPSKRVEALGRPSEAPLKHIGCLRMPLIAFELAMWTRTGIHRY